MKKNTLLFKSVITYLSLLVFGFATINSHAQTCGGSGPSACTPQSGLPDTEGFYPSDTALPCVVDGQAFNQVISLVVPDSAAGFPLDSLRISTLTNLPCGLCWASGNVNNTFYGGKAGCVRVSGISNEAAGEYNILLYAEAWVHLFGASVELGPLNADSALGIYYYVRVHENGEACAPVDTAQGAGRTASTAGSITKPTITGSTSVCNGTTTTLTATGASYYGYAWSNGAFTAAITVSTPGTYTVTVYDNCNSATASVNVTGLAGITVTPSGPTTFCAGGSVTLAASAATSYKWSNGATTSSIIVTAKGTYTVTATGGTCTAASTPIVVTVNPLPTATITASGATTFCAGGSVTLTAKSGAGYTYDWSTGATTAAITVSASGSYIVTATAKGCSKASAAKKVTVDALPKITFTTSGTVCPSGTETITAKATKSSYDWSTGATTAAIKVTAAGTYTVTATQTSGALCSASASKVIASCAEPVTNDDKTIANTNISTTSGFQASVYPNPYSGQFNVKVQSSNTTDNVTVRIYDVNGRMMEEKLNIAYGSDIMLGNGYAAGVYIVRVQQGASTQELRVVKAE
jgi:LysM repeat protein